MCCLAASLQVLRVLHNPATRIYQLSRTTRLTASSPGPPSISLAICVGAPCGHLSDAQSAARVLQALNGGQFRTFARTETPEVEATPTFSRWDDGGQGGWRSLGLGKRVATAPARPRAPARTKSDIDPYQCVRLALSPSLSCLLPATHRPAAVTCSIAQCARPYW